MSNMSNKSTGRVHKTKIHKSSAVNDNDWFLIVSVHDECDENHV